MSTYLYLLRSEHFHKLGISTNPASRILDFERWIPFTVYLDAARKMPSRRAALAVEMALHAALASHRVRGEWYRLPDEEAAFARSVVLGSREIEPMQFCRRHLLSAHVPTVERHRRRRVLGLRQRHAVAQGDRT